MLSLSQENRTRHEMRRSNMWKLWEVCILLTDSSSQELIRKAIDSVCDSERIILSHEAYARDIKICERLLAELRERIENLKMKLPSNLLDESLTMTNHKNNVAVIIWNQSIEEIKHALLSSTDEAQEK